MAIGKAGHVLLASWAEDGQGAGWNSQAMRGEGAATGRRHFAGEPVGPSRSLGAPADPRGLDRCTFTVPPSEGRCDLLRMHVCCQTGPLWTCPTCTGIRRFAAKLHACPDSMKQGVSGNSARKQPTSLRTCGFHAQSAILHLRSATLHPPRPGDDGQRRAGSP